MAVLDPEYGLSWEGGVGSQTGGWGADGPLQNFLAGGPGLWLV